MSELRAAALEYFEKYGWTTMPLTLDTNGLPKKPFVPNWQRLTSNAYWITRLPWEQAVGIGVVLGAASNNLAVIDVDDQELAELCLDRAMNTRRVRTVRKRGHIYVTEVTPSKSSKFTLQYKNREITIELKATGTQVALPPTPGYQLVSSEDVPAMAVPSIQLAWEQICNVLDLRYVKRTSAYPEPWQDSVPEGSRNNTAFREAHRLREAGIPVTQALDIMAFTINRYATGMPWSELERTVRSAYSKGVVEKPKGVNELHGILD